MTDEFYACKNCGSFEEGTHIKYILEGFNRLITEEEKVDMENILNDDLELETIEICNVCNEEYDGIMVASTED